MVKLAEPRERQRYTLVPRGKPLYEDETRFGTKMLEKMGWTKGKGLGANENGAEDFVRVRYKNDAQGLGFEARDDQWTEVEQSFSGLLQSLNENSDDKNNAVDSNSVNGVTSGESLEVKSKKSRARVHYKKFTRSKDLTQYSEKDLANIFGKKALKEVTKFETSPFNRTNENVIEKVEENFHSSPLSVDDYFKMKMEALKKNKNKNDENYKKDGESGELNESGRKVKKKKVADEEDIREQNEKAIKKKEKKNIETNEMEKKIASTKQNKNSRTMNENPTKSSTTTDDQEVSAFIKKTNMEDDTKERKLTQKKNDKDLSVHPKAMQIKENLSEYREENSSRKKKISKRKLVPEDQEATKNSESDNILSKQIKKKKKHDNVNVQIATSTEEIATTKHEKQNSTTTKKSKQISSTSIQHQDVSTVINKQNERQIAEEKDVKEDALEKTLTEKKKKKKYKGLSYHREEMEIKIILSENEEISNKTKPPPLEEEKNDKIENIEPKKMKKKKKHRTVKEETTMEKSYKNNEKLLKKTQNNGNTENIADEDKNTTGNKTNDETLSIIENIVQKNTFTISKFAAEQFRFIDISAFQGSNLGDMKGYGMDDDMELEIVESKNDEKRIMDMWSGTVDKYQYIPRSTNNSYINYQEKVKEARKNKGKMPQFRTHQYNRKNEFNIVNI